LASSIAFFEHCFSKITQLILEKKGILMLSLHFCMNLGIALCLGAMIGLERQWRQRMAGLRTNALVSAGAALFAALSQDIPADGDHQRIAAQVVSGVGFLGAGVIMRDGLTVRGLNTAATLWCSAAVGSLAGFGSPFQAAVGALAILGTNICLRPIAKKINSQPANNSTEDEFRYQIRIVCREPDEAHIRALILQSVSSDTLVLRSIHSEDLSGSSKTEVIADIESASKSHNLIEKVVSRLSLERGVTAATWSFFKEGAEPKAPYFRLSGSVLKAETSVAMEA
jgi:putative Mg2+ transporter-C (MgtC) family protein